MLICIIEPHGLFYYDVILKIYALLVINGIFCYKTDTYLYLMTIYIGYLHKLSPDSIILLHLTQVFGRSADKIIVTSKEYIMSKTVERTAEFEINYLDKWKKAGGPFQISILQVNGHIYIGPMKYSKTLEDALSKAKTEIDCLKADPKWALKVS